MPSLRPTRARVVAAGMATEAIGASAVPPPPPWPGTRAMALATGASAHVGVGSTDGRQGGYGRVVVPVANESATAGITKVSITLPALIPNLLPPKASDPAALTSAPSSAGAATPAAAASKTSDGMAQTLAGSALFVAFGGGAFGLRCGYGATR